MSQFDLFKLMEKKESFTEEEMAYIKKRFPKHKWRILYFHWKQHSPSNRYIGWGLDLMPYCSRKSGVEPSMEVIAKRELTQTEYDWAIGNYGCLNRRFYFEFHEHIESLVKDDQLAGAVTPPEFVELSLKKGYCRSGGFQYNIFDE